jgi:hypothetical protein
MKKALCLLFLFIVSISVANALDSASISCFGRRGHPDRYSYNLSIDSDKLKITKFVGTRGGGVALWSHTGLVSYGPIQRGIINISDLDKNIFIQTFLDEQESWGYTGSGTLIINDVEIPIDCSMRFQFKTPCLPCQPIYEKA